MPLLQPTNNNISQGITLRVQVNKLKTAPRSMLNQLIAQWKASFNLLWTTGSDGITPAQRLEAIGTDGVELMQRSAALVTFLLTQLQGEDADTITEIQTLLASLPELEYHQDGTVTIVE